MSLELKISSTLLNSNNNKNTTTGHNTTTSGAPLFIQVIESAKILSAATPKESPLPSPISSSEEEDLDSNKEDLDSNNVHNVQENDNDQNTKQKSASLQETTLVENPTFIALKSPSSTSPSSMGESTETITNDDMNNAMNENQDTNDIQQLNNDIINHQANETDDEKTSLVLEASHVQDLVKQTISGNTKKVAELLNMYASDQYLQSMLANGKDEQGTPALNYAVMLHHLDIARLLLQSGADPSQQDSRGKTALKWASKAQNLSLENLMTEFSSSSSSKSKSESTTSNDASVTSTTTPPNSPSDPTLQTPTSTSSTEEKDILVPSPSANPEVDEPSQTALSDPFSNLTTIDADAEQVIPSPNSMVLEKSPMEQPNQSTLIMDAGLETIHEVDTPIQPPTDDLDIEVAHLDTLNQEPKQDDATVMDPENDEDTQVIQEIEKKMPLLEKLPASPLVLSVATTQEVEIEMESMNATSIKSTTTEQKEKKASKPRPASEPPKSPTKSALKKQKSPTSATTEKEGFFPEQRRKRSVTINPRTSSRQIERRPSEPVVQTFNWTTILPNEISPFHPAEIPHILNIAIKTIVPKRTKFQPLGANVLFLSARFAYTQVSKDVGREFLQLALVEIQGWMNENKSDTYTQMYWLSNTLQLLVNLKRDRLLIMDTVDVQLLISEMAEEMLDEISESMVQGVAEIVGPTIIEYNADESKLERDFFGIPFVSARRRTSLRSDDSFVESIGGQARFAELLSSVLTPKSSLTELFSLFSSILSMCNSCCVHPSIQYGFFMRVFACINHTLYTKILKTRSLCSRSRAQQIQVNISELIDHVYDSQLSILGGPVGPLVDQLTPTIQLLQFLQVLTTCSSVSSFVSLFESFNTLHMRSVHQALTQYRFEKDEQSIPSSVEQHIQYIIDTQSFDSNLKTFDPLATPIVPDWSLPLKSDDSFYWNSIPQVPKLVFQLISEGGPTTTLSSISQPKTPTSPSSAKSPITPKSPKFKFK